ncbi:PqqD family protein [bacterium]|nr:PqqD family protein [bacterium]NBW98531.1 PqqD family protein [bacterium]NBX83249.1 PqqD family protein [bacterium]
MSNFKITLNPQVTLTEMEGRLVLFSKSTGDFFGLNESALILLKQLLNSDFNTAVNHCSQEFGVAPATIETDLIALVEELERQKLLKKEMLP